MIPPLPWSAKSKVDLDRFTNLYRLENITIKHSFTEDTLSFDDGLRESIRKSTTKKQSSIRRRTPTLDANQSSGGSGGGAGVRAGGITICATDGGLGCPGVVG